jgi:hypothetical protein
MPDADFTYRFVPMTLPDAIQRAAVLYPLTGPVAASSRTDAESQIREKTEQLVGMWRARIGVLTSVGWLPGTSNLSILYCRNCTPSFTYTEPRTRACRARYICPFCWARWVRGIWNGMDKLFPNPRKQFTQQVSNILDRYDGKTLRSIDLDPRQLVSFPFHLLEQHITVNKPLIPAEGSWSPESFIGRYVQDLTGLRKFAMKEVTHHGAFSLTTVEPTDKGWRIRHRRLYKVAADYQPDEELRGRILRHTRPSRSILFGAIARVCRYPVALIRSDPDRTLQWLAARHHYPVRLSATVGALRRKQTQDDEQI